MGALISTEWQKYGLSPKGLLSSDKANSDSRPRQNKVYGNGSVKRAIRFRWGANLEALQPRALADST